MLTACFTMCSTYICFCWSPTVNVKEESISSCQLLCTRRCSAHRRCSAPLLSTSPSSKPKHKHSHHLGLLSWQQCSGGAPCWWTCVCGVWVFNCFGSVCVASALSTLRFSVYFYTLSDWVRGAGCIAVTGRPALFPVLQFYFIHSSHLLQ